MCHAPYVGMSVTQLRNHSLKDTGALFIIRCSQHLRNSGNIYAVPVLSETLHEDKILLHSGPQTRQAQQTQLTALRCRKRVGGNGCLSGGIQISDFFPTHRHTDFTIRSSFQEIQFLRILFILVDIYGLGILHIGGSPRLLLKINKLKRFEGFKNLTDALYFRRLYRFKHQALPHRPSASGTALPDKAAGLLHITTGIFHIHTDTSPGFPEFLKNLNQRRFLNLLLGNHQSWKQKKQN